MMFEAKKIAIGSDHRARGIVDSLIGESLIKYMEL